MSQRKISHQMKLIMIIMFLIFNTIANNTSLDEQIYVLIYTLTDYPPFSDIVDLRTKKCLFKNCYFTKEKLFLKDVKTFDVLLFNLYDLSHKHFSLPEERSEHQIYIFVGHEPPALQQVPSKYNGFFNLTWTYKLDSDITLRYIIIKSKNGKVIGPRKDMQWMDFNDMKPINIKLKRKLQYKHKGVAWLVSHCNTPSRREEYVQGLVNELKKFNLSIDIFGLCENRQCATYPEECHAKIQRDYYFYLAFENSISEDYVTEKVLTATKHFTVPIVYGGADYNRFLPPGSYLDARALGQEKLAFIIKDVIHDKNKYYTYFKWRKYYSLHDPSESPETDEICTLCAFLNKVKNTYKTSIYENLTTFWSS